MWRLNNMVVNNQWVKEEIKSIKICLETNENTNNMPKIIRARIGQHHRGFYQTYKEELIPSLPNLLQKTEEDAAAAKLLQSCLTLRDPIDGSPPGSPVPGILQARTLEWVAISFSNACKWKVKVKSLSRVQLSATPWTAAHQAPPSMGFSRQEYWSGVPWDTPKFILQGHHYPETKTKDITKEKITGHVSFLGGLDSKKSAYNTGDPGSIPGFGYPLQCFCLQNCMDRGTWSTTVYRVAKSKIPLNN